MATYKEIRGVNIQSLESDPTAVEGDVWYNASTSKLKMYAAINAWSSGGNSNTARSAHGAAGTQTAGFIFSGNGPPPGHTVNAETYDGSSWTEVNNVVDSRANVSGLGTQAAALMAGEIGRASCRERV